MRYKNIYGEWKDDEWEAGCSTGMPPDMESDDDTQESLNEALCHHCGWEGGSDELLDDIYNEGCGHLYCPECSLSI